MPRRFALAIHPALARRRSRSTARRSAPVAIQRKPGRRPAATPQAEGMVRPTVIGQDAFDLVQTAMATMSTSAAGSAHGSPSSPRTTRAPGRGAGGRVRRARARARRPGRPARAGAHRRRPRRADPGNGGNREDGPRPRVPPPPPEPDGDAGQRRRGRGRRLLHPRRSALRRRRPPVGGAAGPHRAGAAGRGTGRGGPADARGAHPAQRPGPDGRRDRRRATGPTSTRCARCSSPCAGWPDSPC